MNTDSAYNSLLQAVVEWSWWQHTWFWSFGLVVLGVSYLLWRQQVSWQLRLNKEKTLLRSRIAADLHDEVGSLLMRIHVQVESAAQLTPSIGKSSLVSGDGLNLPQLLLNTRAVSAALRDVVWCMDSQGDTTIALLDRMHDQLEQIKATSWLSTSLEATGFNDLEDLSPKLRQQVYMIFKEAVTNTIRHAHGATHLGVRVVREAGTLLLEIIDDGNAKLSGRSGLGLRNMRKRAASIEGQLEIGPRPGESGFRVYLRVPFVYSN